MTAQERLLEVIQDILRGSKEGMLLEVLDREVARALGRPISRRNLEDLLVRNPGHFVAGTGGRWQVYTTMTEVEPERAEPAARSSLRRGHFVVFDLETLGKYPETKP